MAGGIGGITGLGLTGALDKKGSGISPLSGLLGLGGIGMDALGMNPLSILFGIPGLIYGYKHRSHDVQDEEDGQSEPSS